MRNYMDEEDFDENNCSENENDFQIAEGDGTAHTSYTRHPEMVHRHNFDCRVDTNNENGIFTENGIEEEN